ncbi:tyrosine-protein phosphatase non-receptor type substrate 1-like [Pelodytes ibericus]
MGCRGFLLFILAQMCVALEITSPSSHGTRAGTNTSVPCTFTVGDSPVDLSRLSILWRFQGKLILSYDGAASPLYPGVSLNISRIKDGDASLSIANTTISDGGIYNCSVTYNTEQKETHVRLDVVAPPQMTITGRIVVGNKESILSSSVTGFYPVDIEVKWFRDGESLRNVNVSSPQRNPDGTYSVTSTVTIIPTEENRDQTISCRVRHYALSEPLQEAFQLTYGAVPSIKITSSTFYLNKEQDLICKAWGFYPESIAVNWFLNRTLVEAAKTRRLNDSAVESIYRFLPTEQTQGMELSCQVGHGTLSSPLVKKLLVTGIELYRHKALPLTLSVLTVIIIACTTVYFYRKVKISKYPSLSEGLTKSSAFIY